MENIFTSYDIQLSSFLITKGANFINIKEIGPKHFIFIFSDAHICEKFSREYFNNAPAPARELFSNREMLINQIKNFGNNSNRK